MSEKTPINIISILWGDIYTEADVNILYAMIKRNTTFPINFYLFSNEKLPRLNPAIIKHPEIPMKIAPEDNRYVYRKEAGLCDDNLCDLKGQRVFFFDLDVLIVDNLDDLFSYPKNNSFYIINDWNTRGSHVGQATCYSFVVGTLGYIRENFEKNPKKIIQKYGTASQEYLSAMVISKYGSLNFWPESWFKSFKYHCLPAGILRHFITPARPPEGTKVLAFHGHPDVRDALLGRWSSPVAPKAAKGWKKIYKTCRPTLWIKDFWHDS